MKLRDVFENKISSDVYRLDSSVQLTDVAAIAEKSKFTHFVLDGLQFTNKVEFFYHFGEVMQPPEIFIDWDYLVRQLELTEWLQKEAGEIIVYKDVELFYNNNREDFDVLITIFLHVTEFRNKKGVEPLIIFLQGDEPFDTAAHLQLVTR